MIRPFIAVDPGPQLSRVKRRTNTLLTMAMAMGRSFRVYHNPNHVGPGSPYSLVLEQKGRGHNELLLVENYAVTVIGN